MIARAWNRWWYADTGAGPLGLTRIAIGLLVLAYIALLWPERALWFTERGLLPVAASDLFNERNGHVPRLDIVHGISTLHGLNVFFGAFAVAALLLTLGLGTRLGALATWACLLSLHNRNVPIHNSGDIVMMVMVAYMALAPSGAACSLDRLIRIRRGREGETPPPIIPWAQRLMQLQIAAVYLCTSLSKLTGSQWRSGMAAYYPLHLPDSARFPVPWADANHLWLIHLLTWGAIAIELALWTLVWVPRLRLWVLGAGILLHLGIEYSLNIPLFSALMIASYGVFLTPADWTRARRWCAVKLAHFHLTLAYDDRCKRCRQTVQTLRFFDLFGLVSFAPGVGASAGGAAFVSHDARGCVQANAQALRQTLVRLPLLCPFAPLLAACFAARAGREQRTGK